MSVPSDTTIHQTVFATLEQLIPGTVTGTSELHADLGMDSLDRIELAMALEKRLDVPISDNMIADTDTVNDLIRKIRTRRG